MSNILVAFYSRADENYVNGQMKTLKTGNTEVAARIIAKLTEADIFKIEQVQSYAKDYNECIAQAQSDQKRDARPELKRYPDSLEKYDVIYLGKVHEERLVRVMYNPQLETFILVADAGSFNKAAELSYITVT